MSQITKKEDSEETNEVTENDNSLFKYIKVAEDEGEEPIEIPCENDHTILLTTLTSLFPGASGLKYRTVDGNTMRGLRNVDGRLQPPEEGWATIPLYYCCFPKENKRKIDDSADNYSTKTKRLDEKKKISDLIVLGLPWKTTDKELREYFEQFGELVMAQVKRDPRTGDSKGFGFIRFVDQENQSKVILKRHSIGGRFCDVRVPMSKDGFGEYRNLEILSANDSSRSMNIRSFDSTSDTLNIKQLKNGIENVSRIEDSKNNKKNEKLFRLYRDRLFLIRYIETLIKNFHSNIA
ncbi:TAR DNA-binding protein 43 [Sarcoptes scabiei]|nr:TAR DNA-binding protein 43 [Sarcoptes scabiei]